MTGFFPESAITDLTESDPDAPEFARYAGLHVLAATPNVTYASQG